MFGFIFLPGLARAADQNICKQSWVAQAQLCYRKCLFPAKTEVTASRPFNSLHLPAILFLVLIELNNGGRSTFKDNQYADRVV